MKFVYITLDQATGKTNGTTLANLDILANIEKFVNCLEGAVTLVVVGDIVSVKEDSSIDKFLSTLRHELGASITHIPKLDNGVDPTAVVLTTMLVNGVANGMYTDTVDVYSDLVELKALYPLFNKAGIKYIVTTLESIT